MKKPLEITIKMGLQYLPWMQEVVEAINRDPAREAIVRIRQGKCWVVDFAPPVFIESSVQGKNIRLVKDFQGKYAK